MVNLDRMFAVTVFDGDVSSKNRAAREEAGGLKGLSYRPWMRCNVLL
jgi:hypothetical protein